ncbi:transposon Tf2-9 polyprotein [Trichonephila clavipes]|nr:transposon Tf2-9 polyprotein [Trichonephila clavipes]
MLFMSVIHFFHVSQLEGQTIETYVTQLKTLAYTCEFAKQKNGLIRERIVLGIKDSGLQERLLRENNLNSEKTIEIVRAAEESHEQIRNMKYIKPDPDYIKAIVEMPTPKTEVRRLLGMMNFLSKFIPNVSKVTAPLREIIHENVEFN